MKRYNFYEIAPIQRHQFTNRVVRASDVTDDNDDDADMSWREKSQRLQARRWRKIRQQLV